MESISNRVNSLSPSATIAMNQKSRDLTAKGINVINLSVGEPDFFTPDHIKAAAKKAIDDNFSFYPPVAGFPDLKKAISEKFKKENNLDYSPEQVLVSCGAKHSLANALMSMIDKGDEVIIPAPFWVSYLELVKVCEGIPVVISAGFDNNFKITPAQLAAAISPKTKVTAAVLTLQSLQVPCIQRQNYGRLPMYWQNIRGLWSFRMRYMNISILSVAMKPLPSLPI